MESMRECPFCADDKLDVIEVTHEPRVLAVKCAECGAIGPESHSQEPEHAVAAWNQGYGRLTVVK